MSEPSNRARRSTPQRRWIRSACTLFALSVSWPCQAARARGLPELTRAGLPNIQSQSALVIDMSNEGILYERDADHVRPIASISKLIGSLVIVEECKLDPEGLHEMTTANRDAAKGGDKSKLTTGWRFSHRDLLHAALMRSDNRALPALGEACGMTPAQFGERMTARVRKLGLPKSSFKEPDGLSQENVSTARELITVIRTVIQVPELVEIMGKKEYSLTGVTKTGGKREIPIHSTDRLLGGNLMHVIGAKTGYTDIARYCFAVAARTQTGRDVAMVFLGAEGRMTRFADFTRVVHWLKDDREIAKAQSPLVKGADALAKGKQEVEEDEDDDGDDGEPADVVSSKTAAGALATGPASATAVQTATTTSAAASAPASQPFSAPLPAAFAAPVAAPSGPAQPAPTEATTTW